MIKAINVDLLDEKFSLYKEVTKMNQFLIGYNSLDNTLRSKVTVGSYFWKSMLWRMVERVWLSQGWLAEPEFLNL